MLYFQFELPREGMRQEPRRPVFAMLGASMFVSMTEDCVYSRYFRFDSQC